MKRKVHPRLRRTDAGVELRELCDIIRSKQAGPYRLTFDLFFRTLEVYQLAKDSLNAARIAAIYGQHEDQITDFVFYDPAHALKITMHRPRVSGDPGDGDVYGCQQHAPLLTIRLPIPSTGGVLHRV